MSATRQQLRDIIDIVDQKELDLLYQVLIKFIPEDVAKPDEIESIKLGRDEIGRGEAISHSEIKWD